VSAAQRPELCHVHNWRTDEIEFTGSIDECLQFIHQKLHRAWTAPLTRERVRIATEVADLILECWDPRHGRWERAYVDDRLKAEHGLVAPDALGLRISS